jgi:hypothetical protein
MNLYEIWCDLKPGMSDMAFAERTADWLGRLRDEGAIERFRLTRRKLGFGPPGIGEFHIQIEVRYLAQLDQAFHIAASRAEPYELLHHCVNHMVENVRFALYRDFPDAVRQTGAERF